MTDVWCECLPCTQGEPGSNGRPGADGEDGAMVGFLVATYVNSPTEMITYADGAFFW